MKIKKFLNKTILVLSILLLLFFSLVNFGSALTTLKAASGMMSGGWFVAMSTLAELIKSKSDIEIKVTPGAGVANVPRISENESQIGFSFAYLVKMASEGKDLFAGNVYPNVRLICSFGAADYDQFVVAQDKNINSMDEIFKNKIPVNFGFGVAGSTEEFRARKLLAYYGVTEAEFNSWGGKIFSAAYSDLMKLYQDRHIDAIYVGGPVPYSGCIEMNVGRPIKLLAFPEGFRDILEKEYFYVKTVIPKGTYSDSATPTDIPTLVAYTSLLVNKDVPDDIVYTIAKIFADNKETVRTLSTYFNQYDPALAWISGVTLHPGAEKYYKEAGYMK